MIKELQNSSELTHLIKTCYRDKIMDRLDQDMFGNDPKQCISVIAKVGGPIQQHNNETVTKIQALHD